MACLVPTYSNCIVFTASFIDKLSKLGYSSTNLEDFILEFINNPNSSVQSQLATLSQAVKNLSTENLPANSRTFGLGTGSVDAVKLSNKSVEYSVTDDSFTFSLEGIKRELPTGFRALKGSAVVIGSTGKKSSVNSLGSTLKTTLPATAQISMSIQTSNGILELNKEILLTSNGSGSALLETKDLTTAPQNLSQQGMNELLAAELVALKQKL